MASAGVCSFKVSWRGTTMCRSTFFVEVDRCSQSLKGSRDTVLSHAHESPSASDPLVTVDKHSFRAP